MASRPATETQGPTAQVLKTRCGRAINTIPAHLQVPFWWGALAFDHIIRQLVPSSRPFRKMCGKRFADFFNRFNDSVAEFFILKVRTHSVDKALPEFFTALFMDGFVTDRGEFMRSWRDEDEHSIALARFVHSKPMKFLLRSNQRIDAHFAALNINTDLPGRF
jgi:hypothetical protein